MASFHEFQLHLDRVEEVAGISRKSCLETAREMRTRIQESVCHNSTGRGEIRVAWKGDLLDTFDIACDESMGQVAITSRGTLEAVQVEDFSAPDGGAREFYINDDTRGRLELRNPPRELLSHAPGSRIAVRGWLAGSALDLRNGAVELETSPGDEAASGTQQALAILVNFDNVNVGCTVSQVEGYLFTGDVALDPYYQENSRGGLAFAGDVIGPVTIPYSQNGGSSCPYYDWAYAADDLATSMGYDPAGYDHQVYVLPAACAVAGKANVNGPRSWVFDCDLNMAYAHEVGHNLGIAHASTLSSAYGDQSDVMGCCVYQNLNAPHRDQLQWLSNANVLEDPATGTYTLTALDAGDAGVQALKIPRPGMGDFYYVSYRQAAGFDGDLAGTYANRVNIHRANDFGYINTYFLQGLDDGQTFSENGIEVTLLSHTDTTATVEHSRSCIAGLASLQVTPASGIAMPDAPLSYSVTVSNRDAFCGASTFPLVVSSDLLSTSIAPATLTLEPGATGTALVEVSGSGIADGAYDFVVSEDRDGIEITVTHEVDSQPPAAPTGLTATKRGKRVILDWQAASDNNMVNLYRVYRTGLLVAELNQLRYTETPDPGSHTYNVAAVDGAGNEGPGSVGVDVDTSRGGGGGGRDKTPPSILTSSPTGLLTTTELSLQATLEITTDEEATCRYDTKDKRYDVMAYDLATSDSLLHTDTVEHVADEEVAWYVRCTDTLDNAMKKGDAITYEVDVLAGQ